MKYITDWRLWCFAFAVSIVFHLVPSGHVTSTVIDEPTNENVIENTLKVNHQNAVEIAHQVQETEEGTKEPVATYIEKSSTPVKTTQDKIAKKDPSLPAAAIADTDKTVVSNTGTTVEVYKINTYRNWELGLGAGRYGNENYGLVSIQRNYSRVHSIGLELHANERGIRGGNIQWKVHF